MLSRLLPCLVLATTILAQSGTSQNYTIFYQGVGGPKCLSVDNSTSIPTVVINECDPCSPLQLWVLTDPYYAILTLIKNTGSNASDVSKELCLHAANDIDSKASVVSLSNDCASATIWNRTIASSPLIRTAKGLCLDLSNGNTENNLPNSVLTWDCNPPFTEPKDNQKWSLQVQQESECP